jgi:DNA-nicking Smr family endonuclease
MAKRSLSPEDADLWRAVTRDTRPLRGRNPPRPPERPAPKPAAPPKPVASPAPPPAAKAEPRTEPPPALRAGAPAGVDRRLAERLRRGQLEIEDRIDLHGLTQDEAHARLNAFLAAASRAGRRCVLVITGTGAWREGGGVLREAVPRWLNEAPVRLLVLAIAKAQPRHGGGGALYLLLKRRRNG